MESKLQKQRREFVDRLKTDDELPKVAKKPQADQPKEKLSKREVRTDAE